MVYNGYYKVMSNSPKMGHLRIPVDYLDLFVSWALERLLTVTNAFGSGHCFGSPWYESARLHLGKGNRLGARIGQTLPQFTAKIPAGSYGLEVLFVEC